MKADLLLLVCSLGFASPLLAEWTTRDEGIVTYDVPSDVGERLSDSSRIFIFCERNAPGPWPPTIKTQKALNASVSFLTDQKEGSLQWNEETEIFSRDGAYVSLGYNKSAYPQVPYYIYIAVVEPMQDDFVAFYVHVRFREMKEFAEVKRILSSIKINLHPK